MYPQCFFATGNTLFPCLTSRAEGTLYLKYEDLDPSFNFLGYIALGIVETPIKLVKSLKLSFWAQEWSKQSHGTT